jgi:hypothetical protein
MITLGLSKIVVADPIEMDSVTDKAGVLAALKAITNPQKIGKTYKDSCNINQDKADSTDHYEEGKSAPEVHKKQRKIPTLAFQIMNPTPLKLSTYVGGDQQTDANGWGTDGSEVVANKTIIVVTEQGLCFVVPKADIDATLTGALSTTGILLTDFTVTPLATKAKAFYAFAKDDIPQAILNAAEDTDATDKGEEDDGKDPT